MPCVNSISCIRHKLTYWKEALQMLNLGRSTVSLCLYVQYSKASNGIMNRENA